MVDPSAPEELLCNPAAAWRRWLRERRLGGRIHVRRADVEAWLGANYRPANGGKVQLTSRGRQAGAAGVQGTESIPAAKLKTS